jgi:hypothetical protein
VIAVRIELWRWQFDLRVGIGGGDAERSKDTLRKACGKAKQQLLIAARIGITGPQV